MFPEILAALEAVVQQVTHFWDRAALDKIAPYRFLTTSAELHYPDNISVPVQQ